MPQGYKKDGTKMIPPSRKGKVGFPHSEETKKKISLAKKGKKLNLSNLTEEQISNRKEHAKVLGYKNKGRKATTEQKKKMSESHKGWKGYWLGRKQSEESKKKRSKTLKALNRKGEKAPNWRGGTTPINQAIRMSEEYKLWREAVFERDDWTCIWCGQRGGRLQADHIKRFTDYPELRFAIDNGRTLCEECHRKTDTYGCRPMWKKL